MKKKENRMSWSEWQKKEKKKTNKILKNYFRNFSNNNNKLFFCLPKFEAPSTSGPGLKIEQKIKQNE